MKNSTSRHMVGSSAQQVGVAILGAGRIALANHLPGLRLSPHARLVALCDADERVLAAAGEQTDVRALYTDHRAALSRDDVDAVIVATPNFTHESIVLDAIAAKKHVLCEKPLALRYAAALRMYEAAEAAGVRHMTAFTYRFVPAMRYLQHLVRRGDAGRPLHFRAQRFQDWGDRALGWRQSKALAGTGELGDMLSHRIDYGHLLLGPIRALVADMRNLLPARSGQASDVDDWVAALCQFEVDATGVLESTKLATGVGENLGGADVVELNGSDASFAYSTQQPLTLRVARRGASGFEVLPVPDEFLRWPGSPRDPRDGDPRMTFRYDQGFEFIDAIVSDRPCRPSFLEGAEAQAVMDAVETSARQRRWVEPTYPGRGALATGSDVNSTKVGKAQE